MADTETPEDAPVEAVYPAFVTNDADRKRWDDAEAVARMALGDDAPSDALWTERRRLYFDREHNPS